MSILTTIQSSVTSTTVTRTNPWETSGADKTAMIKNILAVGLRGGGRPLFAELVKFCNNFYTLFWDGKDAAGNETGVSTVDFCKILGDEAASLLDGFGHLCLACHALQPGCVPIQPRLTLHRLPSGWVWPGDLADKPEGWGV